MSSIFRILQTSRPRLFNILKELASFFFSSKAEDPGVTSGIIIVEKLPPLPCEDPSALACCGVPVAVSGILWEGACSEPHLPQAEVL